MLIHEALIAGRWMPCEVLEVPGPHRRKYLVSVAGVPRRGTVVVDGPLIVERRPCQVRRRDVFGAVRGIQ